MKLWHRRFSLSRSYLCRSSILNRLWRPSPYGGRNILSFIQPSMPLAKALICQSTVSRMTFRPCPCFIWVSSRCWFCVLMSPHTTEIEIALLLIYHNTYIWKAVMEGLLRFSNPALLLFFTDGRSKTWREVVAWLRPQRCGPSLPPGPLPWGHAMLTSHVCESHMLPLIFTLGIRHKTLLISKEFPTSAIQYKCVPLKSHS